MIIDSHFHLLCLQEKGEDIPSLLKSMESLGMEGIDIGTVSNDLEQRAPLLNGHPSFFRSAGIGPWATGDAIDTLKQQIATYGPVCAIGEIGLDNHWKDYAPKAVQEALFLEQVDLAEELGLPIIIHGREADEQLLSIFRSRSFSQQGIMHCFEGGSELLHLALDKGFSISFSGVLTYKGNDQLRALSLEVPLDRLLFETDSPYLAPTPMRGRRNSPPYVSYVYQAWEELSGRSAAETEAAVAANLHAFVHQSDSSSGAEA